MVYEIDNPCFLADTFVFEEIKEGFLNGKTIYVKVNCENRIEEIGIGIEDRLHNSLEKIIKESDKASIKHIRSLRKIDHEYFGLYAIRHHTV